MSRFVGDSGTICFYCNNFTYRQKGLVCGQRICAFNRAKCLGLRLMPCQVFCDTCLSTVDSSVAKRGMWEVVTWKSKD
jgi:hypothetical protein